MILLFFPSSQLQVRLHHQLQVRLHHQLQCQPNQLHLQRQLLLPRAQLLHQLRTVLNLEKHNANFILIAHGLEDSSHVLSTLLVQFLPLSRNQLLNLQLLNLQLLNHQLVVSALLLDFHVILEHVAMDVRETVERRILASKIWARKSFMT